MVAMIAEEPLTIAIGRANYGRSARNDDFNETASKPPYDELRLIGWGRWRRP